MTVRPINAALSLTLILVIWIGPTETAESHPHQGKLIPFQAGDPKVKLDSGAERMLRYGKPHQMQIKSDSGERGLVVQDVHAPVDVVWNRILDFSNYPKMAPKTAESQTYRTERHRDGRQTIWVRFEVGFPVMKRQFFLKHEYYPNLNSMTWTLDYSRKSDVDDSCGYWFIVPQPDNPNEWTRVYYSAKLSLSGWIPQLVVDFMSKNALIDAANWVKKFSEEEFAALGSVTLKPKRGPFQWPQQRLEVVNTAKEGGTCKSDKAASCALLGHQSKQPVGFKRYALVAMVVILLWYNIYLLVSH